MLALAQCIRDIIVASSHLNVSHVNYIAAEVWKKYPNAKFSIIEHFTREAIIEVRKDSPHLSKTMKRRNALMAALLKPPKDL